jgi:aryl-alcohol dehydrogenase-like predicted oxidoreductase
MFKISSQCRKAILVFYWIRASAVVEGFPATSHPSKHHSSRADWNRCQQRTSSTTRCFSTAAPHESKPTSGLDDKSSSPSPSPNRIEFVDFWGTKLRGDDDDQRLVLPVDPSLDRYDGPLPPKAYIIHGNPEFDPKPNCRIALSLDWQQSHSRFQRFPLHGDLVVQKIQKCLDAGFQTFRLSSQSIKNSNEGMGMIGRVVRETPKFVDMHWTVRLELPKQITPATVREAVVELLSTTRMDSLDTVLVPYDSDILPQYHLEVMDVLHDMQRDGIISSIGVEEWPASLIKQAKDCGFKNIHVHQQSGNLLLPPPARLKSMGNIDGGEANTVGEWWTNPLAGNFLSENVLLSRNPPVYAEGWNDVRKWYSRKHHNRREKRGPSSSVSNSDVWKVFNKNVYGNLRHISLKHEVSIAAIALRWCLQEKAPGDPNNPASGIIYPLLLVEEPEGELAKQLRDLRDVFRFELDEEDLEMLNSIVARSKPKATKIRIDDVDVPIEDIPVEFLKEFQALSGGQDDDEYMDSEEAEDYPKIDFDNRSLWL